MLALGDQQHWPVNKKKRCGPLGGPPGKLERKDAVDTPYILLVDDDEALLQALPHMIALRIHGVRVDTAVSASDALERIRLYDYDAIVSDIKMPGMDGLELLAKIRELRPETPTLLITGHMEPSLMIEAMKKGAYDFVQKPIERVQFVASLYRAIQTRRLRHRVQQQQQLLRSYARTLEHLPASQGVDEVPVSDETALVNTPSTPFQPPTWLISLMYISFSNLPPATNSASTLNQKGLAVLYLNRTRFYPWSEINSLDFTGYALRLHVPSARRPVFVSDSSIHNFCLLKPLLEKVGLLAGPQDEEA